MSWFPIYNLCKYFTWLIVKFAITRDKFANMPCYVRVAPTVAVDLRFTPELVKCLYYRWATEKAPMVRISLVIGHVTTRIHRAPTRSERNQKFSSRLPRRLRTLRNLLITWFRLVLLAPDLTSLFITWPL